MIRALTALMAVVAMASPMSAQVTYDDILAAPSEDWLTFMGDYRSNRHSPLDEITAENVGNLTAQWVYHVPDATSLSSYPIVYDGVMYVTNANEVHALDARTGRPVWVYQQPDVSMERKNRGAAILGDRVYFITSDCHLVALNRITGAAIWDQEYADPSDGYYCSVAPVAIQDKLIVGVSGGDSGMRGFLAAHSAESGEQLWKLWTVPAAGEPGSETWGPKTLPWGGAGTWMPGSYDVETNLLIWPTGNPWPDFYGGDRPGDNLYTDSLLGVDLDTGEMKWYFQFTPHDVWDWDGQEPPLLLDLEVDGEMRKVVMQANRNGFYYMLDRTTGEHKWEYALSGETNSWAGTLSTAGRVIFSGDDDDHLIAVDSRTGKHLWHFNLGQKVNASPITYAVDGKQYVAIVSLTDVFAFGLFEPVQSIPVVDEPTFR